MAVYYLNRGLILEQSIIAVLHEYLETIDVDGLYKNFHIDVTNSHPFASLYLHNNLNASDLFPAIVVSTQNDDKTGDLAQLPACIDVVGLSTQDIDYLTKTTNKDGKKIPGLVNVATQKVIDEIKGVINEQGYVYGLDVKTRRTDRIGIEIWADNEQVKNELYEIIRLFLPAGLLMQLEQKYKDFDISLFDHTLHGQRGGNYNMDFGVALSGASLTIEVNYCIEQVIVDTGITNIQDVIPGAKNYVKTNR